MNDFWASASQLELAQKGKLESFSLHPDKRVVEGSWLDLWVIAQETLHTQSLFPVRWQYNWKNGEDACNEQASHLGGAVRLLWLPHAGNIKVDNCQTDLTSHSCQCHR